MTLSDADRVWWVLKSCRGEALALTAPAIAERLGMPERRVRRIIAGPHFREKVRQSGAVLLSKPGKGFCFATDAELIQRAELTKRRLKLAAAASHREFCEDVRAAGLGGVLGRARRAEALREGGKEAA
jgi:hypothetical protein